MLHLGAGALTLARYVAATRPGSAQLAVDSDAEVMDLVRERLPLDQPSRRSGGRTGAKAGRVRVRIGDARSVVGGLPAASFDIVVADLFAGARTPAHLTSAEFAAAVRRVLAPDGIFAANIADGPPLAHARSRAASVLTAFAGAVLIADAAVLRGRRFGNLVLAASAGNCRCRPVQARRRSVPRPRRSPGTIWTGSSPGPGRSPTGRHSCRRRRPRRRSPRSDRARSDRAQVSQRSEPRKRISSELHFARSLLLGPVTAARQDNRPFQPGQDGTEPVRAPRSRAPDPGRRR